MAKKLLSMDIREEVVSAVMLAFGAGPVTVVSCGLTCLGEGGLTEAVAKILQQVEYAGEPCRISFEAHHFYFRNLSFPFSDQRKIEKILAMELEDRIPMDLDSVVIDSIVADQIGDESTVVAAMLDKEYLRHQLEALATLNVDPEIVAITNVQTALQLAANRQEKNFVLLDAGCKRVSMFVMVDGRLQLIRTILFDDGRLANFNIDRNSQQVSARRPEKIAQTFETMGKEVNHTLFALEESGYDSPVFLTGPLADVKDSAVHLAKSLGRKVTSCDGAGISVNIGKACGLWRSDLMTAPLALGNRKGKKQIGFNFRKGEFERKLSFDRYRSLLPRLAITLVVCLVAVVFFLWSDFSQKAKELEDLENQSRAIFSATLPEVTRVVDPVQQLKVEIQELKKGMLAGAGRQAETKVLDIMAELSTRIPKSLKVQVTRMVADPQGVLLRGLTDNFNSVDVLKKVLEKSGYFAEVTISSANLAKNDAGIRFELRLQLDRG